jgi:hypothetical protein
MIYATYSLLAFWVLWVLFLAVMNLGQAKAEGKLHGLALYAGYTVLAVGLLVDLVVQVLVATVMWLELPRELTVSERVARLCKHGSGWRQRLALWFRAELLAPFDRSGGHG